MKKLLTSILLLYIVMLTMFTTLIIAVYMIPRSAIEPQVKSSAKIFSQEGVYPFKTSVDGRRVLVDNHTDCCMHIVAYCADDAHPVDAAMRNYRYRDNADITVSLEHLMSGNLLNEPFEYGKYWHGYLVTLRPLLTVMDYGKIRILNGIMLGILFVITLILLTRRLPIGITLCFLVALFMVHSGIIPWSLQFSTCYYITLVSMIALLGCRWLTATWHRSLLCFFAIGSSTAFFDFLTTPMMTLGVPLTVMLLKDEKICRMRFVLALCAAWFLGYGLMWASKWLMAYLLAGYNPLAEVSQSIKLHSVGKEELPMWSYWKKMVDMLSPRWSLFEAKGWMRWGIIAALAIPALVANKGRLTTSRYLPLVFIALLTPLWYIVVARHSYTHFYITSRALLVWWFACLCFLYVNIDFKKLKSHVLNKL